MRPLDYQQPESEAEICEIVARARKLRVVGAGHSFNAAPLCEDTMLNLDSYGRVLDIDAANRTVRFQAGIRLRNLNHVLASHGLALPVLGSTDAQALAGLISTDLHGTGGSHGFLSEQLTALRIVDASGHAETFAPNDEVFRAAIGGAGAVGVITEAELRVVPAFRLRKLTALMDRERAEDRLDALLASNDHVSFYYVGGAGKTRTVRINAWNRSQDPLDAAWKSRKDHQEVRDFLLSAFVPSLATWLSKKPAKHWLSRLLSPDWSLVMPTAAAFGRRLFFRHDEIEYGVPFAAYLPCLDQIMDLLEQADVPSIVETRFTPDTSVALLGPGVGRRTAYIELATQTDEPQKEAVFAEAERILLQHGGQPHLGKWCHMTGEGMLRAFGERYRTFRRIIEHRDPTAKFISPFLETLLSPAK